MELQVLGCEFSICKVTCTEDIDFSREYVFIAKTPDEISCVYESANLPASTTAAEPGWRAIRVTGILDFDMVGVLAKITGILAAAGISIFAVSTYDTDYIFIKAGKLDAGLKALINNGYTLVL